MNNKAIFNWLVDYKDESGVIFSQKHLTGITEETANSLAMELMPDGCFACDITKDDGI